MYVAFVLALLVGGPLNACEVRSTEVVTVYPSGDQLPENLLRFYIYFSAPMGQKDILPSISLFDEDGQELEGVFLSNRFDLWSADRTRLTLLFDPGRVKTGLTANKDLGRALTSGSSYRLVIAESAQDADGCKLAALYSAEFRAGPADLASPEPENWALGLPRSGTRDPITIVLDGAADHLSLAYRIRVIGPAGASIPGNLELDAAETIWRFTPRQPWDGAQHTIRIDPRLEDLAGNRIGVPFDLDLSTGAQSMKRPTERLISFSPLPL